MSWDEPIDAGASMSSAGAACREDCLLGVPERGRMKNLCLY